MDNFNNSNHLFTYLWILAFSILGAITAYIKRKRDNGEKFSFWYILGDVLISFFLGVITYFLCKGAGINDFLTAGFVGCVSHLGTRALILFDIFIPTFKMVFPKVVCKWFGVDCDEKDKNV
ncbi:phage holin family protein [Aliarcobacter lanthieri]|uniref:phage holin family protein n=1 Tax=Aliarcobacter lanthieri TaxID=1355374 RepID=UPI003AAECE91